MDKIKVTPQREIAVILKRKTPRSNTYEAYKIEKGKYNEELNYFIGDNGVMYSHLLEYEPNSKEEFFIGRMPLVTQEKDTEFEKELIADYLNKHKKYNYKLKNGDVICIDLETNKKFIYSDHEVSLKETVEFVVTEMTNNIIQGLSGEEYDESVPYVNPNEYISMMQGNKEPEKKKENFKIEITQIPKEMVSDIKEHVKGQDEAVMSVITQIYQKYKYKNGKKNNMLIVGPTGVGKTYLFEVISKLYKIPLIVFSVPGLSQSGYVGKSVDEILIQLIAACNGDIEKAQNGMVILDEIDKLASRNTGNEGKVGTESVQNELLKMIEGDKRLIKISEHQEVEFDTSNITFIGSGAFQELFAKKTVEKTMGFGSKPQVIEETPKLTSDALVKYGLKRELVGRMPILIQLNQLTEENLYNIIYSKDSEMKKMETLLLECGVRILNIEEIAHKIAKDAIEKNLGARGLSQTISRIFSKILYEVFNNVGEYDNLILGENILINSSDFTLGKSELLEKKVAKKLTLK